MLLKLTHSRAVLLMVAVTLMWSIAGVVTRHLEHAASFEVTFWRSFFTLLALLVILIKMAGMARIQLEMGAWCFVALFIVLTLVSAFYDREALWDRVETLR